MVRIDYDVHWRAYSDTQAVFLDNPRTTLPTPHIEQDLFLQVSVATYHPTWALQYQGVFNHSVKSRFMPTARMSSRHC
ncbi:MAG: hypothetical protein U0361_07315 [Nitrospiraceae bacterium]